jgi:CRISPR-associated protein Cmr5
MNNPLKTLNQLRAEYAYKCVEQVKNTNAASRYKSLAKKLPQMITYNGLLTTLAFLKSKAKKDPKEPNAELLILGHLAVWLQRASMLESPQCKEQNINLTVCELLADAYIKWKASELFQKTAEALAIAQWLKRIAEGELND